jgi:hypothetical protein
MLHKADIDAGKTERSVVYYLFLHVVWDHCATRRPNSGSGRPKYHGLTALVTWNVRILRCSPFPTYQVSGIRLSKALTRLPGPGFQFPGLTS